MRKFLILFCILIPYCCFGQFFDDFSNTISFQKNNWQGDISHFSLEEQSLRLSNSTSVTAYYKSMLAAPVDFRNMHTWEIDATLDFNPSAYNYACFYLISDSPDLKNTLHGFCLQLGGKDDEIKLIRQQGDKKETLLHIPLRLTAASYNRIAIKLVCQQGKWQLYSRLPHEKSYRKEGYTEIPSMPESGFTGWICHYTKTNASRFYLHKVNITEQSLTENTDEPDLPDPQENDTVYIATGTSLTGKPDILEVDSIAILDFNRFLIHFNRPVNISKANFMFSPESYNLSVHPTQFSHILHATLQPTLLVNSSYFFLWNGITDLQGNLLNSNSFAFIMPNGNLEGETGSPVEPLYGEIVISEIMANPKGCAALPEVEYVELYNRSEKEVSLKGCSFYYGTKKLELADYTLSPRTFVILCNANNASLFGPHIPVLPVTAFPVLANTGKLIYLENREGSLLHWIEYNDSWYGSTSLKNGGYSLELIDTDILYGTSRSWKASKSTLGGTPGSPNSIATSDIQSLSPYLEGHSLLSDGSLMLRFSKSVNPDILRASLQDNDLEEMNLTPIDYPRNHSFCVRLPENIITDHLSLALPGVKCIDGRPILDCGNIRFGAAGPVGPNNCVINELLWRPESGNAPFLELFNTGDYILDLSELYIATLGPDSMPINKYPLCSEKTWLEPGKLAIVSTDPHSVFSKYGYHDNPRIVSIQSFPELPKNNGNIALLTNRELQIDRLYYYTRLHQSSLANLTGVSLERRDPFTDSSIEGNWTSGNSATGFATPGYPNHADSRVTADEERGSGEEIFRIIPKYLSLREESAHAHLTLFYKMDEESTRLTVTLFTANGLQVCRLATNLQLETEGDINWSSEWRNDRSSTPGIYLLLLEYITPTGKSGKEKIALPIVP